MAKLLISGLANTGKTSLLQTLENVLVIANDGKKYPFKQPHVNVEEIHTSKDFIDTVSSALDRYDQKFGHYPEILVIDSISKTLLDIEAYHLATIASFPYGPIGKEISAMMHYIENDLVKQGCHVIFVSHAFKDDSELALVNAGGSWGKKGGVLSEVDDAIYVDIKGKKRMIHTKNNRLLSRSLDESIPESIPVEEFSLKDYMDSIVARETDTDEWAI